MKLQNILFYTAKFHEVAKYIILYSKMGLLQPFWSLIENEKIQLKTTCLKSRDQNNIFPAI